jgi:Zn-finger nucleic acid-binding protein
MSERQGIEIDYCPSCRGIWLDRGELDKIIDKAITNEKGSSNYQEPRYKPKEHKHYDSDDYYKHRKKHWLHDLFD